MTIFNYLILYSHLERDGTSHVTIMDPDALTVSPLEMDTGLVQPSGLLDKNGIPELSTLNKEHFR